MRKLLLFNSVVPIFLAFNKFRQAQIFGCDCPKRKCVCCIELTSNMKLNSTKVACDMWWWKKNILSNF